MNFTNVKHHFEHNTSGKKSLCMTLEENELPIFNTIRIFSSISMVALNPPHTPHNITMNTNLCSCSCHRHYI
jgi:hypothetical protein